MNTARPRPSLPSTFDALAASSPRTRAGPLWLPFIAIATLLVLIAALFTALVLEDRQLQREALQRDLDSAAQRFSARLAGIADVASSDALEIAAGSIGERQFASVARDLLDTRDEIELVAFVDASGTAVWPTVVRGDASPPSPDAALTALIARASADRTPIYTMNGAGSQHSLAIVIPVRRDQVAPGAILVQAAAHRLLKNGLGGEMTDRYRVALLIGDDVVAVTSGSPVARLAASHRVSLPSLPASYRLEAIPLRGPPRSIGNTLAWGVGVLGVAALITLAVLGRYTLRLVRTDRALLAETSLRRAMEDSLATGLRVLDRDGVIRYVNRAFCQMTGYAERELIGCAPPFPYWPPEHRTDHEEKLRLILGGEAPPAGFEAVVKRRDGSLFDTRMYVSPLIGSDGGQIGWMTSMADITEPKRIRNELAAAHDRFTKVLASLEAAVSVVPATDDQGAGASAADVLFANHEYQKLFGTQAAGHHRLAEMLRRRGGDAMAGEVQDEVHARWFDVRQREIRWVDGHAAWLQIATDITLRKAAEDIARQQQEKVQFTSRLMTMGEMASSLAHELNQPLTAITNYSQGVLSRLQNGPVSHDELLPALEKTSSQAQRAGRIIRRIREFVKRSEPRRRPTPADRIVDDAIGFAEIEARKRGVAVVSTVDSALPPLDVDPILIEQVLLNLVKNAIDAMDHAVVRRVDIDVRRALQEGMAEITVTDRGAGIPEEHRASLFQPFFSTKSEGMGMGLKICRSIIEFHQGRLAVEDNPEPCGGTVMRFTLPLAGSKAAHNLPPMCNESTRGSEAAPTSDRP